MTDRADFSGDAGDFVGEGGELVDHRVHGQLQFEQLTGRLDGDGACQIPSRHGCRHRRDVAHLGRQPGRHRVHGLGDVPPTAGQALHLGAAAEPSLGADLAGHPGHLAGEQGELVDHLVDRTAQPPQVAVQLPVPVVQIDALGEITAGHRVQHTRGVHRGHHQGVQKCVRTVDVGGPATLAGAHREPLVESAVPYDFSADPGEFRPVVLLAGGDLVEDGGQFRRGALLCLGQPHPEVAVPQRGHRGEEGAELGCVQPTFTGVVRAAEAVGGTCSGAGGSACSRAVAGADTRA
ncbi:hypothetical protein GCM10010329_74790 [Streptomyces spiroverticillatus]|nr:hypothetical protein GCM10010329_74790 [Streptomyces spiroverticillatus]